MECPSCQHENRDGAKFCGECGERLAGKCPSCGHVNRPSAKFCDDCGTKLAAAAPKKSPSGVQGERRQLSVMFCDLVSATELSARLDPEDLREVIQAFQRAATEEIRRFDGHVAQHLGDGLLVYFGYPRAHEDDAIRAGHAALGVIEAVARLDERLSRERGVRLAVRVGIHTGPTVVGAVGGEGVTEQLAIGETPNLAARLQGIAEPNTAVVSAETERLLRRAFRTESRGAHALKGFDEAREVFRVVTRGPSAEEPVPRTPFVGREAEVSALRSLLEQAKAGSGRSVLIRGEAGVGKSRLCSVLDGAEARVLRSRGSTFFAHTPFQPVGELLRQLARVPDDEGRLDALRALIERLELSDPDALGLLAPLLGVDDVPLPPLTPQIRKGRTLALLVAAFLRAAELAPTLIVLEDVHWVDESTLELVGGLAESLADAPLLLVLTARPEFRAQWHVQTELALHRLPRAAIDAIIDAVGEGEIPPELAQQITLKADGNPLFAEELAQMVIESGLLESRVNTSGEHQLLAIPATLHDSLMARLDQLPPKKKTLVQLCSTIGRRFSEELLREILRSFEEEMQNELRRITDGELIYQRGVSPRSMFVFKHALVQDAAYASLLKRTRRKYHQRVADVLSERFPETPPEVLAHHLTEGNRPAAAVPHWHAAGQAALGAFALGDAMSHLSRGLACVEQLPEGDARLAQELALRGTLGVPLMLTQGFASSEVEANYSRMLELCQHAGDDAAAQVFPALWGLWTFYIVSGQHPKAEETASMLRGLGERTGDVAIRVAGLTAHGAARLMRGHIANGRRALEEALASYDRQAHGPLALQLGQDLGAMCLSFLTWAHVHAGEDEQATLRAKEADALADALAQPSTRAFVDTVLGTWSCVAGDPSDAARRAEVVVQLAAQMGMPHWDAQARIVRGWSRALGGESAVEDIRAGVEALTAMGSMATMTLYWAGLAEAELAAGRLDEARAAVREAAAYLARSDERVHEAGLAIMDGRVALAAGDVGHARAAFERALAVAQAQEAHGMARRAERHLAEM